MIYFKTGDLIARKWNSVKKPLQIGIVVCHNKDTFTIKWTSFDKFFFMEKEGDIFAELNKTFLLNTETFYRNERDSDLCMLSPN